MNPLERFIHRSLEGFPYTKNIIRDIYQLVFSLVSSPPAVSCKFIVRPGHFFGFHNICPWSFDNRFLLTHRCLNNRSHKRKSGDVIEIGFFSGDKFANYTPISETPSWNWQQGAMLQWIGNTHRFIFNYGINNKRYARIFDTYGYAHQSLDTHIAAVSPDGKLALSFSFDRLETGMPGYGYYSSAAKGVAKPDYNDELSVINIETNQITKLFSTRDIADLVRFPSSISDHQFFTHCLFSPNGTRFAFFFRSLSPSGTLRTRLITSNIHGSDLYIFPTTDFVSHFCWVDDSIIITYSETYNDGRAYLLFKKGSSLVSVIDNKYFKSDGHPSVSPDKCWLITDTYPDRNRHQKLILFNLKSNSGQELISLRIPFRFRNEFRCDFHPRWDRFGRYICFDSAHTGVRSQCTIDTAAIFS